MDFKSRASNPYFWVSIVALLLATIGVSPETLTSWNSLQVVLIDTIGNPYLIGSCIVALLGIIINPTTTGLKD